MCWNCACARLCTILEFFYKLVNASLNKNCCSQHDYYHIFMTHVDRVFFIFYSYWFTKVTPGAHKHKFNQNWMMFRVIMFWISILHVGEYTAYNSGESIKNWVRYNIPKIQCLLILIFADMFKKCLQLLLIHILPSNVI